VIVRRRQLPGGRAVAGAFVIALAAVLVYWAVTRAEQSPHQLYVVATHNLVSGERLTPADLTVVPLNIPDAAVRQDVFGSPSQLLNAGASVIAPIDAGALVEASEVVGRGGAPGTRELSLDLDRSRAVGGTLKPGEPVDVLATFGSGASSSTQVIAPHVTVLTATLDGDTSGSTSELIVLAVPDGTEAEAIANDAVAAQITLVRSAEQAPTDPVTTLPTYQPASSSGGS
jgi:Flp pilus assembly protein CpaB